MSLEEDGRRTKFIFPCKPSNGAKVSECVCVRKTCVRFSSCTSVCQIDRWWRLPKEYERLLFYALLFLILFSLDFQSRRKEGKKGILVNEHNSLHGDSSRKCNGPIIILFRRDPSVTFTRQNADF